MELFVKPVKLAGVLYVLGTESVKLLMLPAVLVNPAIPQRTMREPEGTPPTGTDTATGLVLLLLVPMLVTLIATLGS